MGGDPNIIYGNLSPLHWAINFCYNNNNKDGNEHIYKDIVKHLIDYDADIEISCEGHAPTQFAGYTQYLKIIKIKINLFQEFIQFFRSFISYFSYVINYFFAFIFCFCKIFFIWIKQT